MKEKKVAAIILAAGLSSRMGKFKALLPFNGMPTLSFIIRTAKRAGIENIIVVTGHNADQLQYIIQKENVTQAHNNRYMEGMFTSVQTGVAALNSDTDAFFLLPVDYPLIPPKVLLDLMKLYNEKPDSFFVPCFNGKKGHPPIFPMSMAKTILNSDGEGGLKAITRSHEDQMVKVETEFEAVVMDMDTPEDYQELVSYYKKNQIPDEALCLKTLENYGTPMRVQNHCKAVTRLATKITKELNTHGFELDENLIQSAGLLHDIVRKQPKHALAGALIAEQNGWYKTAALIENHMFYIKEGNVPPISEQDILCLADKMFKGDAFIALSERALPILKKFEGDAIASEKIKGRFQKANELKDFVSGLTGKTMEEIWESKDSENQPKKKRRLFLIRHGQPRKHREKIFLGQTDVELSSQGALEAKDAGRRLLEIMPAATKIYSSDLKRARQTAEIIIKELKKDKNEKEIIPIPEFREMNLGSWDGLFISDIKTRFPKEYEERGENLLAFKIDQNSENYYDLRYRVMKRLNKILGEDEENDIIIVAHAGVIAAIRNSLEGLDLEVAVLMKQKYGEICTIEI
ncbi:DVU_1551 family NTP transferase [Acetobacterium sp.]|uniref:DVU_1551 family NTP transferase n=1 Tax=Acetobacterium sp. TaxID=1872094 RepID=UPI002F42FDB3